jgi:hypothetical protein
VCLSFSAYHPELWQPAWGIRLILEALVSFLPSPADGAIGALDWTKEERQRLAKKSVDYCCPTCGKCSNILLDIEKKLKGRKVDETTKQKFQKDIEKLHALQAAMEGPKKETNESSVVLPSEEKEGEIEKKGDIESTPDVIHDTVAQVSHDDDDDKIRMKDDTETALEDNEIKEAQVESCTTTVETRPTPYTIDEEHIDNVSTRDELASPILSDPMANLGIVIFSIIVYLMIRKIRALVDDLIQLEAQFKNQHD